MLLFEQIANDLRLALPPMQVSAHTDHRCLLEQSLHEADEQACIELAVKYQPKQSRSTIFSFFGNPFDKSVQRA